MEINMSILIPILVGIVVIGGAIVGFFQMQTRQNMKLDTHDEKIKDLEDKISKQSGFRIQTEKKVEVLCEQMGAMKKDMDEIKMDIKTLLSRGSG